MEDRFLPRRTFLRGVCTAGAGLGLAGATAAGVTGQSETDDAGGANLRIGTIQPPVTLDPITAGYLGSSRAIGHVFDGLYTYGEGTDLRPQIAAGKPSAEGSRTVLVELDPEATFQNGDPVTAGDVRYSFEAPQTEDTAAKGAVSPVESVEVVDDRTVRFRLAHPYPGVDELLTRPVVAEKAREADPEQFAEEPVGAGPFEVESFSEEKKVQLTRWSDYWGSPAPDVERVTITYVESPLTAMTSLLTNRSDVVEPVSTQIGSQLPELAGASVETRPAYRSYYFGFNVNEGPTTEKTVREAFAHCVDLDAAVESFLGPHGRRQYGPVPPRVADDWGFPREKWRSMTPEKDTQKARELFEEADESVGRPTILTSMDPRWKELGQRLARGLRDAGQAADVKSVTWKRYLDRYVSGSEKEYAVFVGEIAGTADPDSYLYPVVHENMQGLTNGIFYNDEEVMNALLEARRTTDRGERADRYTAATEKLLRDRVLLPVCTVEESFASNRSVRGLNLHPVPRLNPRLVSPTGAVTVEGHS